MKTLLRYFMVIAVLFSSISLVPQDAMAQTAVTQTILSTALSATGTTMNVASATGFTASSGTATYFAYIDRELVQIRAVSGTVITIMRGQQQTRAMPHRVSAVVYVGSAANFAQADPGAGQCTLGTSQQYTPVINIVNGNIWNCSQLASAASVSVNNFTTTRTGVWQATNLLGIGFSMPYTTVVNSAYTMKMSDVFIDMISMTAARTISLVPVTGIYGKVAIIKNSAVGYPLTVNTSPVGQYVGTIGTTSATITSNDTILRLLSVGGGWITW